MENKYKLQANETEKEYCHRIAKMRFDNNLSWSDIADICNDTLGKDLSGKAYCTRECRYREVDNDYDLPNSENSLDNLLFEIKKEKYKLADERSQANALIRRISREETIKEIAEEVVNTLDNKLLLPSYLKQSSYKQGKNEAILLLSDWHYGIDIDNAWNKYNPDIAKIRLGKLRDQVVDLLEDNEIRKLHVINLGDLISGRIHSTIRINNRIDVITQTIEVSELLAEFLNNLSGYVDIEYHDTADNHSRLEPNIKESLELESLTRIITEFLKLRLKNNKHVKMIENKFGDDMTTFEVCGHKCIGVHGNKDKTKNMIDRLTLLTKDRYDLVVSAHLHHPSMDTQNDVVRLSNGSMMGTDDYALNLRLNSKPSQTLIISDYHSVIKGIHILDLE